MDHEYLMAIRVADWPSRLAMRIAGLRVSKNKRPRVSPRPRLNTASAVVRLRAIRQISYDQRAAAPLGIAEDVFAFHCHLSTGAKLADQFPKGHAITKSVSNGQVIFLPVLSFRPLATLP